MTAAVPEYADAIDDECDECGLICVDCDESIDGPAIEVR